MESILKLRVTIKEIRPQIWREVLIKSDISFIELHNVIQVVFGWLNSHLYDFNVEGKVFSLPDDEYSSRDLSVELSIAGYLNKKGAKALYTYDFGDSWIHEIEVIDIVKADKNEQYPKCIAGKRNGPPEDCGGVFGYENIIQALNSEDKEEFEETLEWLGDYDPEYFDIDETNEILFAPDDYLNSDDDFGI